jgi:uncharacterized protein (TIGR02421 family)
MNGAAVSGDELVVEAGGDTIGALIVRFALSAKGVRFEQRMVSKRTVPAGVRLRRGDNVADGVLAAVEHIEETFRDPPLLSVDPTKRARARRLLEVTGPAFGLHFPPASRSPVAAAHAPVQGAVREQLESVLGCLDRELESPPNDTSPRSAFTVGSELSIGGVCVMATCFVARAHGIELEPYPCVQRVFSGLRGLPAFNRVGIMHGRPTRLVDDMRPDLRDRILKIVLDRVEPLAKQVRVLDAIAWPRSLEEQFFAQGKSKLPEPRYELDRGRVEMAIAELASVLPLLKGDHVLLQWLHRTTESFIDAHRLVLAVGTPNFYQISLQLYGGARTTAFDRDSTNYDLATHIAERVGTSYQLVDTCELDTDAFVARLEEQLNDLDPPMKIDIVRDPNLSAKAICGRTRIRIREGAKFSRVESRGLFLHEIQTHALTAQNGSLQKKFPLLASGGPRTTRTQEGLAVFSELMGRSLSTPRLLRLAKRVQMVGMAEEGASFLDLFRHLVDSGLPERDAYLDAQRICRGGVVKGGAPFTKDACYLAGLFDVYDFISRALRFRTPLLGDLLLCGRMALEDTLALLWLRNQKILEKPKYLPGWAAEWDGLLSYFSFTSFLDEIENDRAPQLPDDVEAFIQRSIGDITAAERSPCPT